jgi:hypothetical protein
VVQFGPELDLFVCKMVIVRELSVTGCRLAGRLLLRQLGGRGECRLLHRPMFCPITGGSQCVHPTLTWFARGGDTCSRVIDAVSRSIFSRISQARRNLICCLLNRTRISPRLESAFCAIDRLCHFLRRRLWHARCQCLRYGVA